MLNNSETLTKTQKKYLNLSIKIFIVTLTMYFVALKVSNQQSLKEFEALMRGLGRSTLWITMILVVALMFLNWSLEVIKWRFLSRRLEVLSYWKATKSVFCGLTWAIFTPNRIGEYGGRVMLLRPRNRVKGAVAMGVGLLAQLVLTSVFGALSIAWFVHTFLPTPSPVKLAVWIIASIYALGFVIFYFNVRWIDRLVKKVKLLRRIKPFFSILKDFNTKELGYVLWLSFARFAIFTSQYIILMMVILPDLPFISMVLMIFILFFVQSATPSLDIFDFSVRSFVASNLYSYITTEEIAVMAIVSCVWFVNLIFPAIIGAFFTFNVNYVGGNGKS